MSSSELCDSSLGRVIPALQNRMSSRPYRSTQTSIIRSLSARRLTSAWTKHAVPPACAIARTTASASASCTSARTRRAPCCAKRRALARPMPLPAPVMTAALPSRALLGGGTEALACGAQTLDAQLHLVAVDEVARRALAQAHARRCAGGNDVAGQEGHELRDVADGLRHIEDELASRAALLGLAVHFEPEGKVVHVPDLVGGGDKRAEWRERVAALALHPLPAALELEGAFRVIVVKYIPGHVLQRLGPLDVRRAATDDDRQLHLPVDFAGVLRNDDIVVRTGDGGRRLEEEDGLIGDGHAGLAGVVPLMEPDAPDLAGPANRGPQARVIRDNWRGGAILGEPAGEPLETARPEEGFVVIGGHARSLDAPAVGQDQAGSLAAGCPESDEFHGSHLQGHEAAVDGVVRARDERRRVGAEKQRELGDLLRLTHAPDRLCPRQLVEHLPLPPRIVLRQEAVDEGGVDPSRGDRVAADPLRDIVAGD